MIRTTSLLLSASLLVCLTNKVAANAAAAATTAANAIAATNGEQTATNAGSSTPPPLPPPADPVATGDTPPPPPDNLPGQDEQPPPPPPPPPKVKYFVLENGVQVGPMEQSGIEQRLKAGTFTCDKLIWTKGMAEWAPASTRAEIKLLCDNTRPAFDPQKFLIGTWSISGQMNVPNMGTGEVQGQDTYFADGSFSSQATLTVRNPFAGGVQQPGFQLPQIVTFNVYSQGSYSVIKGTRQQFSVKYQGTFHMSETSGMMPPRSEAMDNTPEVVIVMDSNTYKNGSTNLIYKRVQ